MSSIQNQWNLASEPEFVEYNDDGKRLAERWRLPLDEDFLQALLRDIFENHWHGIRFGPIIEGAAYEWMCPGPPQKISYLDGYLTIMFGTGGHFHLCIGVNNGTPKYPTPADLIAHRKPSLAEIFRKFSADEKPVMWGFEMRNGANEAMLSVFFPNPFIENDDSLSIQPDFSRLETWRAISSKWLGREAEVLDEQGNGFGQA
jgi:hypothetical protein